MASSVFNNSSLFFIIVFSAILLPVLSQINSEDVNKKVDVIEERPLAFKFGNDGPEGPPHTVNIREPRSLGRGNYGLPGLPGIDDYLTGPVNNKGSLDLDGRPGLFSSTVMAMHCRMCQKRRNRVCIRRYCN
ncbi:hypothetical protein SNE40_003681 [Patella caerulea]